MADKKKIQLIECPRDAMQGWAHFIPTERKIAYLQQLLTLGFDTLDFGSYVSPKAIPQLADTDVVLQQLEPDTTKTDLLAIVANLRGAQAAALSPKIKYIGFPFSVSETFQQRNTNASIATAFETVKAIQQVCVEHHKTLVVYLSMGFGNPYGDPFSEIIVTEWAHKLAAEGITILSLADTVGVATPEQVFTITASIIQQLKTTSVGVHLHARKNDWEPKVEAALKAGCVRFDAAIMGFGGCPMAGDALVGNIPMEDLVAYLDAEGYDTGINRELLAHAVTKAQSIFI